MDCFDEHGRPIAVDYTHPVDLLEPETSAPDWEMPDALTLSEEIAETYVSGDPTITRLAWRYLLNHEPESIRTSARKAGCSAAAISRRLGILKQRFGMMPSTDHLEHLRRWEEREARRERKRRRATRPPAAADEQLEDNSPSPKKGGRP